MGLVVVGGLLGVALFVDDPLFVVPMVSFVWLLVLREKGYWVYALPVFLASNAAFFVYPGVWTGFVAIASMILFSVVPARRRVMGKWAVASKDGLWSTWWLPRNSVEDIGAVVGDASVHLIVLVGLVLFVGIALTVGL